MSFDDGVPEFDVDGLKAKLRWLLEEKQWGFGDLCSLAGLSEDEVLHAINQDTLGYPGSLSVLQKLAIALDVQLPGLISGHLQPPIGGMKRWSETKQLLWEFIYKQELPICEGRDFETFVRRELMPPKNLAANVRYRSKTHPSNLKEVAVIYARFRDLRRR